MVGKKLILNRDPSEMSVDEWDHVKHFVTPHTGIFVNLFIYMVMTYTMSIIASTLPVPTGALIPAFKIGAGLGRLGRRIDKFRTSLCSFEDIPPSNRISFIQA